MQGSLDAVWCAIYKYESEVHFRMPGKMGLDIIISLFFSLENRVLHKETWVAKLLRTTLLTTKQRRVLFVFGVYFLLNP